MTWKNDDNDTDKKTVSIEIPQIIIPLASYQKVISYVEGCDTEITGFADVEYNRLKNAFIIGEVYLLKQEAQAAEVDMDDEVIADFLDECIKNGMTQLPRVWWHSHVHMSAFFSGTDTNTISSASLRNDSYLVALVFNKKHEYKAMIKVFTPFEFEIEDVPLVIDFGLQEVSEEIKKEIAQKVKPPKKNNYGIGSGNSATPKGKGIYSLSNVTLWFPKDPKEALARITQFDLHEEWDNKTEQYIWINHITKVKYVDHHHVLDDALDKEVALANEQQEVIDKYDK